jgi:hypothetical protein
MRMSRTAWWAVGAVMALTCSACGGHGEDQGPRYAATAFERAVEADDGAGACALLAPETRSELEQSAGSSCAQAIVQEDLPEAGAVDESSAFGTMAQVRFTSDTLFLSEFPGGWKVLAAGCAPVPRAPYDCSIQGG